MGPAMAQQQTSEKKPVPSFTDDDAPAGMRATGANTGSDSWGKSNAAWSLVKSLRARITIDSPNGRVDTVMEAVQPDRFHMTTRGIEIITIGGTTYMKAPGTAWEKQAASSPGAFSLKQLFADELLKGGQPTLVGAERIDGVDTDVYDVSSSLGATGSARVWIGKSDGLPRRLAGNIGGMGMTVTFYDFNRADISILAPM